MARNVAVQRSNPANRWILSTNTDMIFVPHSGRSLSEIAADLPDGFYHLPRFEVLESLWESLDRMDQSGTIAKIGAWGRAIHLNEEVHAHDPWVKFDGPGDRTLAHGLAHPPGVRDDPQRGGAAAGIRARRGAVGHVVYGPYATLSPDSYEAVFRLQAGHRAGRDAPVEVVSNDATYLAHRGIVPDATGICEYVLPFEIASGGGTGRAPGVVGRDLAGCGRGVLARHVEQASVPVRAAQIVEAV